MTGNMPVGNEVNSCWFGCFVDSCHEVSHKDDTCIPPGLLGGAD